MYKYSIISVNFGNYDGFWEPERIDPQCEYVYVTDNPNLKSKVFKIILLKDFKDKSSIYKAFYVRYHVREFISTDLCVWIDGSVLLHKSLSPIIDAFIKSKADMCCPIHYGGSSSYNFVERWYKGHKLNEKRRISDSSFRNATEYAKEHLIMDYKGHAEANFQILNLKNSKVNSLREEIWNDLLRLGDGEPFRVDEFVLSVLLQTKYKDINLFMVQRQILQSSFMTRNSHSRKKPIPKDTTNSIFYFYNKPQKVHTF